MDGCRGEKRVITGNAVERQDIKRHHCRKLSFIEKVERNSGEGSNTSLSGAGPIQDQREVINIIVERL